MSFGTLVEFGVTPVKVARAPLYGLMLAAVLAGCAACIGSMRRFLIATAHSGCPLRKWIASVCSMTARRGCNGR